VGLLYDYDLTNFNRHAWRCRLSSDIALNDLQQAMQEASNTVMVLKDTDIYGTDTWSIISGDDWMRWWHTFLRFWENKCKDQWQKHFGSKDEERTSSKSWNEIFIPYYLEGCFVVKHIRVREIKQIIVQISNAPGLREDERSAWLRWGNVLENRLDDVLIHPIATHIRNYEEKNVADLDEDEAQDKNTTLEKLKYIMLAKRSWTGKIVE